MKRIVKETYRVMELFVNVRKKTLRVVEYGTWYVAKGSIILSDDELESLLNDTDHDINPILQGVFTREISRRNYYFSSKTGKPLSRWFKI